jgi:multidrug resistance efflux pump
VKPGEFVRKGDVIAVLNSREVTNVVADLSTRRTQIAAREGQIRAQLETTMLMMPAAEERLRRARSLLERIETSGAGSEGATDIISRQSQVSAREAQITSRLETIRRTLPYAKQRAEQAQQQVLRMEELGKKGLTTNQRITEVQREAFEATRELTPLEGESAALETEQLALRITRRELDRALEVSRLVAGAPRQAEAQRELFEAQREHTTLTTQRRALGDESANVSHALSEIDQSIREILASYNQGVVLATADGTIGPRVPHAGHFLKSGDALLDIYSGTMQVLAYLPTGRLYSIASGDRVSVSDGQLRRTARVDRIEQMTDSLPPEFQVNFRATDRQQILRVTFDDDPEFPILAKVKVTSLYSPNGVVTLARASLLQAGEDLHGLVRRLVAAPSKAAEGAEVTGTIAK